MRMILLPLLALGAAACTPMAPPPWLAQAPPPPGELLLSNLDFGPTHVEAVITANPDCNARAAGYVRTQDFVLPERGTRILAAPPGAGVCWRRDRDPEHPVSGQWTDWARAYLQPGQIIDSTL
jgi:hypothetical protein